MTRLALIPLVAAATLAATTKPAALALGTKDVSAGAKTLVIVDFPTSYSAAINFKAGSREEELTTAVWVGNSKAAYEQQVEMNSGFPKEKSLHLPSYGDQQIASFISTTNAGAPRAYGVLVVRKGNVVWSLTVESCGAGAPAGCVFGPTPRAMTQTQAISELERYAKKQAARIR